MARGTVMVWAPQRDTGSARIGRWVRAEAYLRGLPEVKRNPAGGSRLCVVPHRARRDNPATDRLPPLPW